MPHKSDRTMAESPQMYLDGISVWCEAEPPHFAYRILAEVHRRDFGVETGADLRWTTNKMVV